MLKWLMPKEVGFFDFFEGHASTTVKAAQELLDLISSEDPLSQERIQQIQALEHQADTITHSCVESLHKTFITPFERNDIYRLISRMDDIIDFIEETAARIVTYKLTVMTAEAKELATLLFHSTQTIEQAVKGLRYLKNGETMRQAFFTISRLESEGDAVVRRAIGKLFDQEGDAINIIKWKEIYENIEEAIDRCEDVSNIIEGVILESD